MNKIKSLDDLRRRKQELEALMNIREKSNNPEALVQIRVGMATCGIAAGARTVMNALIDKIEQDKLPVVVTLDGCMGYCYAEPTIEVTKPGENPIVFGNVTKQVAMDIIEKYILRGEFIDGVIQTNYQTINENK